MQKQLRDYILKEQIAEGGMSTLFLGVQKSLDREVAIKILLPALAFNESFIKRFEREAKIVSRIQHHNIVSLIDFGIESGTYFIVMEYVRGMDLRKALEIEPQIPPAVALAIVEEVSQGLEAAHDHGVWHRDIKPANVLLSRDGEVKILDFGLAREASDMARFSAVTQPGTILGTAPYMSPEQATRQAVDQRSDIFSLGVVLHEMLTGGSLFAGRDVDQIAHNVAYLEHAPPSRANAEVPQMLDFVVARALKKDPAVRYQDAYEMCADLRDALAELKARAPGRSGDETERTQTLKLEADAKEGPLAPAASQIVADTRLPLSRQFDSSTALERLQKPSRGDRKRLALAPRPVGLLRRIWRDRLPRRLFAVAVVAGCLGALAAFA